MQTPLNQLPAQQGWMEMLTLTLPGDLPCISCTLPIFLTIHGHMRSGRTHFILSACLSSFNVGKEPEQ